MDWRGMRHACERERDVHAEFWCLNLRDINYLQDIDVDGKIIVKWILKKYYARA